MIYIYNLLLLLFTTKICKCSTSLPNEHNSWFLFINTGPVKIGHVNLYFISIWEFGFNVEKNERNPNYFIYTLKKKEKRAYIPQRLRTFHGINGHFLKGFEHRRSKGFTCWSCVVCVIWLALPVTGVLPHLLRLLHLLIPWLEFSSVQEEAKLASSPGKAKAFKH